jgi:hypothetical protein
VPLIDLHRISGTAGCAPANAEHQGEESLAARGHSILWLETLKATEELVVLLSASVTVLCLFSSTGAAHQNTHARAIKANA